MKMLDRKFLIAEPWDFVVELKKGDNIIQLRNVANKYSYRGIDYDVFKVMNPFMYKDLLVKYLFISKRHREDDNCFNAHIGIWDEQKKCAEGDIIHTFIGGYI